MSHRRGHDLFKSDPKIPHPPQYCLMNAKLTMFNRAMYIVSYLSLVTINFRKQLLYSCITKLQSLFTQQLNGKKCILFSLILTECNTLSTAD